MAENKEEKELIKKRGSFKGRVTSFGNYLKVLNESLDRSQVNELQLRVDKLIKLYDQYDEVQTRLECIVEDVSAQMTDRTDFESTYYKLLAEAQEIISVNSKAKQSSTRGDYESVHSESQQNFVKLPTIELPKFSGSYENWLEFHDTFTSLIHENNRITDINKFHYLRASLQGSAAVVIQSIEFSSINYQVAWKLLCERFDNRRLLIQNHVSALFNLTPITKESSATIRHLLDDLNKNLRALESLKEPTEHWDTLLIYIIANKLDQRTYREWEEVKSQLDKNKTITLDTLVAFLRSRADLLETLELSRSSGNQSNRNSNPKIRSMFSLTDSDSNQSIVDKSCPYCKGEHELFECPQFTCLTNEQRLKSLPDLKVCYNCFRKGHYANKCKRTGCKICKRKHNTLIHLELASRQPIGNNNTPSRQPTSNNDPPSPQALLALTETGETSNDNHDVTLSARVSLDAKATGCVQEVLLSTALVKLHDAHNREHVARAVLDSGSTSCLMSERLHQQLNLPVKHVNKSILGVNNSLSHVGKMCQTKMQSINTDYSTDIVCFVLPSITDDVPSRQVSLTDINIPNDIALCDPDFHTPSQIDLILGADIFWDLLGSQKIDLGAGKPILYETKLGWLVSGPVGGNDSCRKSSPIKCNFTKDVVNLDTPHIDEIHNHLTQFWKLEEVDVKSSYYSEEEKACEEHFVNNFARLDSGRFCVRVPLKQPETILGDSFERAKRCFLSLERRLQNNTELKKSYCDFMSEYELLGHMTECQLFPQQFAYFIPHHGVMRESSSTTKLRVVFNASSPTTSGYSLNNIQMVGPTIQDDLLSILIRFRQHKFILSADVEKMYRQTLVHPNDRHLQQIIWRSDPSDDLKVYQLNTVTYGTASAPFLAVRCLKQVGLDCNDSKIAQIIISDFYVDDLLTGVDSIEEGIQVRRGVTDALNSACMPLRKWKSNSPSLISDDYNKSSDIQSSVDLNVGCNEQYKTLGLGWRPQSDELHFSIDVNLPHDITKRTMLSLISQVFDPLGLLSPIVISFKIILQKLWIQKLSWDETVPAEISELWCSLIKDLPELNNIRIPRRVFSDTILPVELHVFTDASQVAYGACVYARSINNDGTVTVRLLIAKSRVAPIKPVTIPRLELCGAMAGARLYEKVANSLRIKVGNVFFWTDSTIVLGWLKMHPIRLQPFVRNRVAEILEKTGSCIWRHVPTNLNPADYISRGISIATIQTLEQWWCGPEFLGMSESHWPSSDKEVRRESLPEIRPEVSLLAVTPGSTSLIDFTRFSNLTRLKRTVAYVLRFIDNSRSHAKNMSSGFTAKELECASNLIVKISQIESFPEYTILNKGQNLPNKNALLKFNVFLDANGIMRVGGRLSNSDFQFNKKHPILIQSNHIFSKLLFKQEHLKLLHAGPQMLLASIKENYWPIGGRNLAKACCRSCVRCCRIRGETIAPRMGDLPQQRVRSGGYPFENVGIDYAGPMMSLSRQGRGSRLVKVYIAVFVCFSTKAMHLELVGDLTSNCFLSSLRRFISRRGKPINIYSDNGTSFVGACTELEKFLNSHSQSLSENVANEGIHFHFSPPYAPHFGGLWEAGVKSTKYHLKRVLGNCNLTYEEFNTVLVQIEAVLNSRPLTPLSSSPDDLQPLTPGHFLIGRPMTALPTENYVNSSTSRLSRYQRIEQLRQHFWTRWSLEYIAELQQRTKWRTSNNPLQINTMVLIKDSNLPPLKWRLGRIISVFPGQDGINRVADIRTASGVVRRAFSKICPLPVEDC